MNKGDTGLTDNLYGDVQQIKLIPPGCQTWYKYIITSNDNYFAYAATLTINVFYLKNFQIKCILNPSVEKTLKCMTMNQGSKDELVCYYEEELLVYSISKEHLLEKVKFSEFPKFIEFNNNNILLIVTRNKDLKLYDYDRKMIDNIGTSSGSVIIAKFNPFQDSEVVIANEEGKIILFSLKHKLKNTPINLCLEEGLKINEVSWYNSDENYKYLLIGIDDGSLILLDLIQSTIIQRFEKFGTCVENIVWLKNEPGTFFTTTKKSGRIVFWNVSKKTYKEVSKISNAGILSIIPLSDPNQVLVSLDNGSILIYDVIYERCLFELEPGHNETIFDLKFNPIEYGIVATCSYDTTIKIWNIEKNKVITTLKLDFNSLNVVLMNKKEKKPVDNERISVYCLCWSLRDKNLLLSGDSKGSIRLWDISKSKLIYSTQCSSKEDLNIVGIDWDDKDNIIVGCYDNNVYLFRYEINKIDFKKVFKLGSSVYQIKFNPFVDAQFAAACNDFHVKICNFESEKPVQVLSGHSAKVFGVEWNPKRKGILASSSDDDRIGIWDLDKKSNFFLSGHSSKARHLVWLNDFPPIIISSSWDGTIKFWNIDTRANLITIIEHYSDVYGIGLCPHHPFLLISSSRDTSIRFWNFQNISRQLAKYLVDWHEDRKNIDVFHLNLQDQLKLAKDYIDSAEIISKYFFYNEGITDLFDILKVIKNVKQYCNDKNTIFYINDLYSAYLHKSQQLEYQYYSSKKVDYNIKKEDLLKEACDNYAKLGEWEKFCELNVEMNNWEKALIAAPHVSIEYWKELTTKYSEYCNKNNKHEKNFASILSNNTSLAYKNLMESGLYEDAKLFWLTRECKSCTILVNKASTSENNNKNQLEFNIKNTNTLDDKLSSLTKTSEISKVTYLIARDYLTRGFPVLSASSHLSIKDYINTIKTLVMYFFKLIRANEAEIAFFVSKIVENDLYQDDIITALCLRELRKGNSDNYFYLLSLKNINSDTLISLLMYYRNFYNLNEEEVFKKVNLTVEKALEITNSNNFLYYVLKKDHKSASDCFFKAFGDFSDEFENNQLVFNYEKILNMIKCFKATTFSSFESEKSNVLRKLLIIGGTFDALNNNLKGCSGFYFELVRISAKYDEKEKKLVNFIQNYLKKNSSKNENWHLDLRGVTECKFYNVVLENFLKLATKTSLKYYCDDLYCFYFTREEIFPNNTNYSYTSGFNGKLIKGKVIKIKDKNSLISTTQGLEWFKYIPFSPLNEERNVFIPY